MCFWNFNLKVNPEVISTILHVCQSSKNDKSSLSLAVGRVWRISNFQKNDSHGDFVFFRLTILLNLYNVWTFKIWKLNFNCTQEGPYEHFCCFYIVFTRRFELPQNVILPAPYHNSLKVKICIFVCSVQISILTTPLVRECNFCILESNV